MSNPAVASSETILRAQDPYRRIVWAILFLGAALRVFLLFSARSTHEDFYITLRYVENIAGGHGFVYNIGQRVLGTTTPLYTLVLALAARAGLDPILFGKFLGMAADVFAGAYTYRLGKAAGRPLAGLAAAICITFAPVNLTWSTKGMESGIVAAAAVGAWAAWAEKREIAAWITVGALVLLRIDGAALAVIMFVATISRDGRHRIPWRGLSAFLAVIAPWMIFAAIYFGSPIPHSVTAKLAVYGRMIPGRFPQMSLFISGMFHNSFGKLAGAGCLLYIIFGYLLRRRGRAQGKTLAPELVLTAPLIWIAIYYGTMALSHVVLFGWYYVPPTPIYYLVAMVGISMAAEHVGLSELRASFKLVVAGAVVLVSLLLISAPRVLKTLHQDQAVETELRIPIGVWLHDHALPNDTVMLEPIGYIGYYSKLRVIDEIGLVSPEALQSYDADVTCPEHDLWQRLRPDWLLLRAGELKLLNDCERALPPEQRLSATYTWAYSWKSPGNPNGAAAFVLFHK